MNTSLMSSCRLSEDRLSGEAPKTATNTGTNAWTKSNVMKYLLYAVRLLYKLVRLLNAVLYCVSFCSCVHRANFFIRISLCSLVRELLTNTAANSYCCFRLAYFTRSIPGRLRCFSVRERYQILRLDILGFKAPRNVIYVRILASYERAGV